MDPSEALDQVATPTTLSILTLTRPILHPGSPPKRTSSGSASSDGDALRTPSAIQADLTHYQELFSKLRFSYVEQVTKERFLRAVTAEVPEFVSQGENAELEEKLKGDKEDLRRKKEEVRGLVAVLEEQGRGLAGRYEELQLQTSQLESLPAEIENLQTTISTLQASQTPQSSNPSLSLPLQPTLSLLSQKEAELSDLDRQIAALRAAIPAKKQAIANLEADLVPLEQRKEDAVRSANEARQGRENGGKGDELEERGRWLRGVEGSLKTMLEV